ncbi:hypothetical protein D3C87_1424890 [compost metagenome]
MNPGAIQFTRTPNGANSTAIALVIDSIAPLLAEYAITFGIPYCDAIELILIMLPPLFSFMFFTTALLTAKTLKRLVWITDKKSSSVTSKNSFLRLIPALFTKMSIEFSLLIFSIMAGIPAKSFRS